MQAGDNSSHDRPGREGTVRTRLVAVLPEHSEQVCCVAFSSDSATLAAACLDGTVSVWDGVTSTLIRRLIDVEAPRLQFGPIPLPRLAFSPDSAYLAVAIGNGRIRIYNDRGESVACLSPNRSQSNWSPTDVAFSIDGSYMLSGDTLGDVHVWALPSWKYVGAVVLQRPSGVRGEEAPHRAKTSIGYLSAHPDQRLLALMSSLDGRTLQLLRVAIANEGAVIQVGPLVREQFEEHPALASALVTKDNLTAIVDTDRRRVDVLDAQTLQLLATLSLSDDIPVAASFVLENRVLAVAGGNTGIVRFWDIDRFMFVGALASHTGGWGPDSPAWKIGAMSSTSTGNLLAVAGMDYPAGIAPVESYHGPVAWTVKIWDISAAD